MCPGSEKSDDEHEIVNEPEHDDDGGSSSDDEGFWFSGDFFTDYNGEANVEVNSVQSECFTRADDSHGMTDIMLRLGRAEGDDIIKDYRERSCIVQTHMGNMTLCRGDRGKMLFQSGAIASLLATLAEVYSNLPPPNELIPTDESTEAVLLATACWGAIRDLSCHNAEVRSAVRTFACYDDNGGGGDVRGLQLMARYLAFYDLTTWEDIVCREHLSLLTSTIGAMRNITHSTGENCMELHSYGVTSLLSWRLLHAGPSLPDVDQPWREAAFRAGASLINMAEKCPGCASECAKNVTLLHILIECWGGKACNTMQAPMLHLGLAAILKAAKKELPAEEYAQSWNDILQNEEKRKRKAQRKEQERKERIKGR